ncbi:N-acetyltransferase [Vibrio hyugaensis]|uniref:N-acetyltransferase n=1 Tax=Vibrio hyugaensis TaxID=1534743 RepID=A0ABQ5Y0B0_9VIBR|nr:GNAT family N-acetyltransferase [Vibrio hyugaensis]GLR04386.1 N-acetyltransferase [Vibrio hyugaensis]
MKISLLADFPHEAPNIAKWYYDEWASMAPDFTEAMVLEKVIEKSVNRNEIPLSLVAHIDKELVGVIELKFRENKHYPEYEHWVGGVYTHPGHRGKGVAHSLLNSAKEKAISLGVKQLYLQCESFNVELYLHHGFKVLHEAKHHEIETTIMVWEATT